ncbi:hypothetical protein BPOR_0002g00270 [Botrytis porri]|uniref:Uncharacterized protein n=1 Tax=Botrytis porri TaxID=87229 RepID=A0A4Z1L6I9_9HELO|nr:hypothetical protein BPOR_0002g00270 [Botrytis porri]
MVGKKEYLSVWSVFRTTDHNSMILSYGQSEYCNIIPEFFFSAPSELTTSTGHLRLGSHDCVLSRAEQGAETLHSMIRILSVSRNFTSTIMSMLDGTVDRVAIHLNVKQH